MISELRINSRAAQIRVIIVNSGNVPSRLLLIDREGVAPTAVANSNFYIQ